MTRGTERDAADCNIDNIDEYHATRDEALTDVKAPPPSEYDIAQFKEAFADNDDEYDYDMPKPDRNAKQLALIWYSDTLYSASELRVIMPKVVPHYNEFDGVKTIQLLTAMYPEAYFLPSREYGVAIFVYPPNDTTTLKKPNKIEIERLKADSCTIHVILREDALIHVIELTFDGDKGLLHAQLIEKARIKGGTANDARDITAASYAAITTVSLIVSITGGHAASKHATYFTSELEVWGIRIITRGTERLIR